MIYRRSFSLLFGLAAFFAVSYASAEDMPANSLYKPGYTLDFSDEFDQNSLDSSHWTDYYLPHWCKDPETSKGNYRFEDGCLVEYIAEDQKPWCPELDGDILSSAVMSFDQSWIHNFSGNGISQERNTWYGYVTKYGYFEIRAKLADCRGGGHQAWWMVGMQQDTNNWEDSKETAEIDILENFFDAPSSWKYAAHGWNDPDFQPYWYVRTYDLPDYTDLTDSFHIYAMEWTPSCLKFYLDNQLIDIIHDSPDYPMGTILNIYANTGTSPTNNIWPKEWYIDYFRVWKPDNGYAVSYYLKDHKTSQMAYIDPYSNDVLFGAVPAGKEEYALWNLKSTEDGYVTLQNVTSGDYINFDDTSQKVLHNATSDTFDTVKWNRQDTAVDYTLFTSKRNPSLALSTDTTNGILTLQEISDDSEISYWELIPADTSFS